MADADAVQQFLESNVHVPRDRIINLRNGEANREAIIAALKSLAHERRIASDDPILIYYAGHGSEAKAPTQWEPSGENRKIQMLLPCDFQLDGPIKSRVQGIFDFLFGQLLEDIAANKSDNITVILDCCHSGSGTRSVSTDKNANTGVRGFDLPKGYQISTSALESEDSSRGTQAARDDRQKGLRSHVLLAACKQGQVAREDSVIGHGWFTYLLLRLFSNEGIDKISYREIIQRLPDIPMGPQNPQCEGSNQDRILFNGKVSSTRRILYDASATEDPYSQSPYQYQVMAGDANGITKNAEFAVFADREMTCFVGVIVAQKVDAFSVECSAYRDSLFSMPSPAYALQIKLGEGQSARIMIENSDAFLGLFTLLSQDIAEGFTVNGNHPFLLVNNKRESPDLSISNNNGIVQFNITDSICEHFGLKTIPALGPGYHVRIEESLRLRYLISCAANFYWNLHHSPKDPNRLAENVKLECFRLKNDEPDSENLIVNHFLKIDVRENGTYGFKITNNSSTPLYVGLFYFDMSTLAIVRYDEITSAKGGNVDYSLPGYTSLAIGYGKGDGAPQNYALKPRQPVDVGYLKLYVSREYVDYSTIIQPPPFESGPARHTRPVERKRKHWNALVVAVIQAGGTPFVGAGKDAGRLDDTRFGAQFKGD